MMIKLKTILTEGFAWEREEGKPLPTLEQTTAAYARKMAEQSAEQPVSNPMDDEMMDDEMMDDEMVDDEMVDDEMMDDEMDESAKPDFLDLDNDGNEEESMKSAAKEMNEGFVSRLKKNLIGAELRK
jgi:hypothetical protein